MIVHGRLQGLGGLACCLSSTQTLMGTLKCVECLKDELLSISSNFWKVHQMLLMFESIKVLARQWLCCHISELVHRFLKGFDSRNPAVMIFRSWLDYALASVMMGNESSPHSHNDLEEGRTWHPLLSSLNICPTKIHCSGLASLGWSQCASS